MTRTFLAVLIVCAALARVLSSCDPTAAQLAAVTEDPRIRQDVETQGDCRQQGRDVQLDAGGDASPAVVAAAFAVYCACTVDAGLRGTCVGVSPQ